MPKKDYIKTIKQELENRKIEFTYDESTKTLSFSPPKSQPTANPAENLLDLALSIAMPIPNTNRLDKVKNDLAERYRLQIEFTPKPEPRIELRPTPKPTPYGTMN